MCWKAQTASLKTVKACIANYLDLSYHLCASFQYLSYKTLAVQENPAPETTLGLPMALGAG